MIRFDQRLLAIGDTRSGKSTAVAMIYKAMARLAPGTIIDPQASELTLSIPGHTTIRDPYKFPTDGSHVRYVPRDADDLDAMNEVFKRARRRRPGVVWTEEAENVLPSTGRDPRAGRSLQTQGAKEMVAHLVTSTSPTWIYRGMFRTSQHFLVFVLPDPDDQRYVAKLAGIPLEVLQQLLGQLEEHGFLHLDKPARRVTLCPPLRLA